MRRMTLRATTTFTLLAGLMTSAAAQTSRITERDYGPVALRVETQLRREQDKPLQVDFHRRQAFRLASGAQLLSIAWWPEPAGEARCVLASVIGERVQTTDALAGEADPPPWSCDGEPALRFTDLDADGCVDAVALYPMRPPSGERFLWPLVLHCAADGYALDEARTRTLRTGKTPSTLAQALQRLSRPAR